jgi:hypothetical protein
LVRAKALNRLEQVLNTEIAGELRANRPQTEPKTGLGGRNLTISQWNRRFHPN